MRFRCATNVNNMSNMTLQQSNEARRWNNWDDGEIRQLIELWEDDRLQRDLEGAGRNITASRVVARMSWM